MPDYLTAQYVWSVPVPRRSWLRLEIWEPGRDPGNPNASSSRGPSTWHPCVLHDLGKQQILDAVAAANPSGRIVRRDLMVEVNRVILNDPTPVRPAGYRVQLHRVFNT